MNTRSKLNIRPKINIRSKMSEYDSRKDGHRTLKVFKVFQKNYAKHFIVRASLNKISQNMEITISEDLILFNMSNNKIHVSSAYPARKFY